MTGVSRPGAARPHPLLPPQAPATVAPTPATTPTPTPASQPVVAVPQAAASAPQRDSHESASLILASSSFAPGLEAQQAADDAQPVFPSRRSQRQVVRDAHVPQPIPAPEEAPAAQQVPIPRAHASHSARAAASRELSTLETMLIPKVRQAAIPVPEPVVVGFRTDRRTRADRRTGTVAVVGSPSRSSNPSRSLVEP